MHHSLSYSHAQAPRVCRWRDVQHLVSGGSVRTFLRYAKELNQKPALRRSIQRDFDPSLLNLIENQWMASLKLPRQDDVRVLSPVINTILWCAAGAATTAFEGNRMYYVTQEPAVVPNRDDRLSDDAVWESITENDVMRIIVEVKGSNAFPKFFPQASEQPFCQLIQEVALALESKMWKVEILAGLVTRDFWYIFHIQDISARHGSTQFQILNTWRFTLQNPNVDSGRSMMDLLDFLTEYLCNGVM